MKNALRCCFSLVLTLSGCSGNQSVRESTSTRVSDSPLPHDRGPKSAPDAPIRLRNVGFKTPESVLHDVANDRYLVSNIDGSPSDADERAFISRLRPDGSVEALRFIDSAQPGVSLNAPKGMAIVGDVLYVADITVVRKFDTRDGKPRGAIAIPGATFLNDVTADAEGIVYVTDSGLTQSFEDSGTDAIHRIDSRDRVSTLVRDSGLGHPNGIVASEGGLWVATFGSGELYFVGFDGTRGASLRAPAGSLDGVLLFEGRLWVASWEAGAVFQQTDGAFERRFDELAAPADIGLDVGRRRVLVPQFNGDEVDILSF